MLGVDRLGPRSARPFRFGAQIVKRLSMLFLDSSTRLVSSLVQSPSRAVEIRALRAYRSHCRRANATDN